jgi:hypothetical protein
VRKALGEPVTLGGSIVPGDESGKTEGNGPMDIGVGPKDGVVLKGKNPPSVWSRSSSSES